MSFSPFINEPSNYTIFSKCTNAEATRIFPAGEITVLAHEDSGMAFIRYCKLSEDEPTPPAGWVLLRPVLECTHRFTIPAGALYYRVNDDVNGQYIYCVETMGGILLPPTAPTT